MCPKNKYSSTVLKLNVERSMYCKAIISKIFLKTCIRICVLKATFQTRFFFVGVFPPEPSGPLMGNPPPPQKGYPATALLRSTVVLN